MIVRCFVANVVVGEAIPSSVANVVTNTSSTTTDPEVQFLGATNSSLSSFSTRPPSIRTTSSGSSITAQVRDAKQKATLQDWSSKRDVLPQSKFGLDPRGKNLEPRPAELYIVEQGVAPAKLPSRLRRLKLNPLQQVTSWSDWAKEQARGFTAWTDRKNPQNIVEDKDRKAWLAMIIGNGQPTQLTLEEEGATLQHLLLEVPNDGKSKIGLIPLEGNFGN